MGELIPEHGEGGEGAGFKGVREMFFFLQNRQIGFNRSCSLQLCNIRAVANEANVGIAGQEN